jgi:hypothetical protein
MANVNQGTDSTQSGGHDFQTISGGRYNTTSADYAAVDGGDTNTASGPASHAEGYHTTASGSKSHAEGASCVASGHDGSHAEGKGTIASGDSSHAEGDSTLASGDRSHAEGQASHAVGCNSHAEGQACLAAGPNSHAQGEDCTAWGLRSHAAGYSSKAFGEMSMIHGDFSIAGARTSIAIGDRAITTRVSQVAIASSLANPLYGMPGDAQCSWLPLKGRIEGNTDNNSTQPYCNLITADGALGWSRAEDGKAYSVRVTAVVAAVVSHTGNYGGRNYVAGQRLVATLTMKRTFRVTGGTVQAVGDPDLTPPQGNVRTEWQGDYGTEHWKLAMGDDSAIQVVLPQGSDDPPVNCKIAALVEFQEVLFPDFSPDEVAGITCWLKPDSNWVNNTALTTWSDASGHGIDFTQATGANNPNTRTGGQAGSPYVEFDGTNDFLVQAAGNLGSLISSTGYTIFIVAHWLTATAISPDDPRANDMILADDTGKVGFGLYGTSRPETISYNEYIDGMGMPRLSWARSYALDSQPLVFTTCHSGNLLSTSTAGGNGDKAGAIQQSGTVSGTGGTARIGVNYSGLAYAHLAVYEVIIFNRELNIGERVNIVGYLSHKYQLSTN